MAEKYEAATVQPEDRPEPGTRFNPERKTTSIAQTIKNGIINDNPVLSLVLGTCPTLAISVNAGNAIGMGIAATAVLIGSNLVISLLRKIIPDKVRIPAYVTVIAGFVSIVQLLVKAYMPALDKSLGLYLPLIVVNCIILGRAEMFASKNTPLISVIDGVAMGIGFTAAIFSMAVIREFLGAGSLAGVQIIPDSSPVAPITLLILPPGGFFVYGMMIALIKKVTKGKGPKRQSFGCAGCPSAATCSQCTLTLSDDNLDEEDLFND